MSRNWEVELQQLSQLLPGSEAKFKRLNVLLKREPKPRIAVFGKYNHGKSTLLNALVGEERFKVADKRETREISEFEHDGTVWIDTPGLDADVHGEDDRLAMIAALEQADLLLLVHNVKAGELDRNEMKLYKQMMRQDYNYHRKLLLVLTQIDQVSSEELVQVENKIRQHLPDLEILPVSAMRFARGIKEDKAGFVKASGMLEFNESLELMTSQIDALRKKEGRRLVRKARDELKTMIEHQTFETERAELKVIGLNFDFREDLAKAMVKSMKSAAKLGLA